jgi:hypothetical protein
MNSWSQIFSPVRTLNNDDRLQGVGLAGLFDLENYDERVISRRAVIDKRPPNLSDLSLLRKLQLKILGHAYIGHRRYPGWKGALPFYVFRCPIHGLVEDYPHGYSARLECPRCLREEVLLRAFDNE